MRISCLPSHFRTSLFAAILYFCAPTSARAQAPYLYASIPSASTSQVAAFSVDSSGALTAVSGSPFPESREGGLLVTDPADQFLFVLNATSNTISVMSIAPNGALTEVPGSPVSAPTPPPGGGSAPSAPTRMATFKGASANYLYVAYSDGPMPFTGAIVEFQIGTTSQESPLSAVSVMTFEAAPVDIAITPQDNPQGYLYVAFRLVSGSTLGSQTPGTAVFTIDATSGQLSQPTFINSNLHEDSLALNSGATVLFDGEGSSAAGFIESAQIRSNGTTLVPESSPVVSPNSPPSTLLPDGSSHLLYVQQGAQAAVYTIDQTTGGLSAPPTAAAPITFNLNPGMTVANPVEPYLYVLQSDQIHVFEITDFTSGALHELVSSPVNLVEGAGSVGLALTHNAINQAAPQDAAQLVPAAINFIDTKIGQSVSDNSALLTNTGTEPLNATVTITGADQSDFTTTTCASPLASRTSCSITVTFAPTLSGARQATLVVADSAGPQTLQLTGNGLAAQPTVSLTPSSLTFAPTTAGGISAYQSVVLTNSGSANLHISSILVGGQNSTDFAITNSPSPSALPSACTTVAYAPNASCSITIVFTPLAPGARNASITVADDAPGSPQTLQLSGTGLDSGTGGTGNPTPAGPPAITVSASSLTFISTAVNSPTTEQYVTIANSGASGSSLIITNVALIGTNSADFKVANGCTTPVSPQTQGCTLSVIFTPSAFGARTASLVFTDNAAPSTQTIPLAGSIQNGTEVLTINYPGGASQSVSAGGTATYLLSLVSNFSGTVTFSQCVGAPATATCAVQPASIVVVPNTANTAVPLQVTVATAAAASSVGYDKRDRREITLLNFVRLSSIVACALFFVFFDRRRWQRTRLLSAPGSDSFAFSRSANVAVATILATCALTFAGCGGASTIATAPAVTPTPTAASQTYTISITPNVTISNNAAIPTLQPIQLTLIVD